MSHALPYEVNCSILLTDLPLLERPAAAKEAGFDAVEFWWPFEHSVPADADVDAGRRGCFFVNCVTELAPHDAALAAFGQRHLARTGKLVAGLLERAGLTPELAQTRAAALLALVIGTITLRKAGLPAPELLTILNQAQLLLADTTSSI